MLMRRRSNDDRGAVAVIVVLLFASLVVFGLGALAIDTGQFYAEKAQLQNGADAGALAVAKSCAKVGGACDVASGTATALTYADANANDNKSRVEIVCGSKMGGCTGSDAENLCPDSPTKGNWVTVQTKTDTSESDRALPPIFDEALGNYSGVIHACAQAIWGPPKLGVVLALTFAECAWNTDTLVGGARNYAPAPPTLPSASYEHVLQLTNPDDPSDPNCTSGPGIGPLPGGFGWTVPTGLCTGTALPGPPNNWYESDPGNGTATGTQCVDKGSSAGVIPCAANPVVPNPPFSQGAPNACPNPATPSPILIPIYDQVCSNTGSALPTQDEIQTVQVNNKAAGGTYTVTFVDAHGVSKTTVPIAWNAAASTIQTALQNLSTIGANNVTVTGTLAAGFKVEFVGTLANTNFPTMTANDSAITPNNGKVTVSATQEGNLSTTTCPSGSSFTTGKSYYHILTLAAFVITGYGGSSFQHDQKSWLTNNKCPDNTGCLLGYFTTAVDPGDGVDPDGSDAGVTAVQLSG